MITCSECGKHGKRYVKGTCKRCYDRRWRKEHPEKVRTYHRKWSRKNPEYYCKWREDHRNEISGYNRKYSQKIRGETWAAYGNKCAMCEINDPDVLSIDHINGRTPKDNFTGPLLWSYLKRNNWPKDKYRLLCRNCNWKKRLER